MRLSQEALPYCFDHVETAYPLGTEFSSLYLYGAAKALYDLCFAWVSTELEIGRPVLFLHTDVVSMGMIFC